MAANDDTTGRTDEAAGDGAPISTGDTGGNVPDSMSTGTDNGQAAQAPGGAEPVGQFESMSGTVVAVRADGTRVELNTGDPIYQGDTLVTGADGSVGVVLADQTTFSMVNSSQMVIDQMVYDPGTNEGSISISVVEGVFIFVSGQIAKTDPDAMSLNIPVATIGIRGTQVGIEVGGDKPMNVVLMEKADGFVGEVVVANDGGVQILNQAFQATNVASSSAAPSESYIYDTQTLIQNFRGALGNLPTTNDNNANNYGVRPDDVQREQTQQEQTQNENLTDEQLAEEETTEEGKKGEDEERLAKEDDDPNELAGFETAAGGEEDPEQLAKEGDVPPPDPGFDTDFVDVTPPLDLNLVLVPQITIPTDNDPPQVSDLDDDDDGDGNDAIPETAELGTVAGSGTGDEDSPIASNLTTAIPGGDDDVVQSATISGLPTGATLGEEGDDEIEGGQGDDFLSGGAGDDQIDGGQGLDTAVFGGDFNNFTIVEDADGTFTVTDNVGGGGDDILTDVETLSFDDGSVDIADIGLPPVVTFVPPQTVNEDTDIPLNIGIEIASPFADLESIAISGVPEGAELSLGTDNGDGTWTIFTQDDFENLASLTLTPIDGDSTDLDLSVSASVQDIDLETGQTTSFASAPVDADVTVDAVVDDATVTTTDVTDGVEDGGAINLDITASLPGGSDDTIAEVAISGIPDGATLASGTDEILVDENGNAVLTPDQLVNLTITLAAGDSEDFTLQVNATSQDIDPETGTVTPTSTETPITVQVTAVADEATVTTQAASGDEDTAIDLNVQASIPGGDDDTLTEVVISGVPTGATLSLGTDNGDGTWTISGNDLNDLGDLTIKPPVDSNIDFTLNISATTQDVDPDTGAVSTTTSTGVDLPVTVLGVADDPTASAGNVSGGEDAAIPLNITANLTDTDGSKALSVTISGVPTGAVLSLGTDNGDGSWTISDPADIAELNALTFTPPKDFFGDINLAVSATSTEDDGDTATTAPINFTVSIDDAGEVLIGTPDDDVLTGGDQDDFIDGKSGDDTLTGGAGDDEILGRSGDDILDGGEGDDTLDGGLGDDILLGGEGDDDLDGGSGDDLLDGGTGNDDIVAGNDTIEAGSGDDTVDGGAGDDTIDGESGDDTITGGAGDDTIDGGAGDDTAVYGGDFDDYTIVVYENGDVTITGTDGTVTLTDIESLEFDNGSVDVDDIGLPPIISVTTAAGDEDSAIALDIDVDVANPLASVETVTIEGTPAGSTLMAGTDELIPEADGSYLLSPPQLEDLNVTPPQDFNGSLTLEVTASTSEGVSSEAPTPLPVAVAAVDDAPDVTVGAVDDALEDDTEIELDIAAAVPDSTETVESITISSVPNDATLSTGTDNGDGTWTLTPTQLENLTITPTAGSSADIALQVTATSTDGGVSDPVDVNVRIDAVADTGTVAGGGTGAEDGGAIDLNLTTAIPGGGDDAVDSITISSLPTSAVLSTGTDNGDGTWTVGQGDIASLQVTPPAGSSADFDLQIAVTTTDVDPETGAVTTTSTETPITVQVTAVADTGTGLEDGGTIAFNLTTSILGGDDDAVESITISGLLAGATLSTGTDNGDGTFTVAQADIAGLQVTPPLNSGADFDLQISVTTSDFDPDTNTTTTTTSDPTPVTVQVTAVADEPTINSVTLGDPVVNEGDGGSLGSVTVTNVGNASAGYHNSYGYYVMDENGNPTEGGIVWADVKDSVGQSIEIEGVDPASIGFFLIPNGDNVNSGLTDGMPVTFTQTASGEWHPVAPDGTLLQGQGDPALFSDPALNEQNFDYTQDSASRGNQNWEDLVGGDDNDYNDVNMNVETTPGSGGGNGTATFPLDVQAVLNDTDGSETLNVTIAGVPDGAELSAGTDNGDGTWTLTEAELAGLELTVPTSKADNFDLHITATSTDTDPDTQAQSTADSNPVVVTIPMEDIVVEEGPGTEGDDVIIGTEDDESIEALGGGDVVVGNAGDDVIDGGAGDDILIGDAASEPAMYLMEEGSDSIIRINADGSAEIVVTQDEIKAATGESDVDMDDRGIAVDGNGNLFFTEDDLDSILMKPADGGPLQVVATENDIKAATGESHADPKSLTVGNDGNVYVSDDSSDSILRIDPATGDVTVLISEQALDDLPGIHNVDLDGGIVTGLDGTIFAASDGDPDAIFAINPATGEANVLASGTPFEDLDVYMTIAPNGDLIVADDSGANTIYSIPTSGDNQGEVSVFLSPADIQAVTGQSSVDLEGGIGFDANGNFFVAEENSDSVIKFSGFNEEDGTIDASTGEVFLSQAALEQLVGGNADLEGGLAFGNDWTAVNETAGGDDVLIGGAGNDTTSGGGGADHLMGGEGDDTLNYNEDSSWSGNFGARNVGSPGAAGTNDFEGIGDQARSHDVFDGGEGDDTLEMTDGNDALFLDDSFSDRPDGTSGPRIVDAKNINAGAGDDVVDLTSNTHDYGDVNIDGGSGDDVLWASSGDDNIDGGTGNDALFGGTGDDNLDGGAGFDTAFYAGNYDEYNISFGDGGVMTISGPEGTDTLSNIEILDFKNGQVRVEDLGQAPSVQTQAASGREDNSIGLGITVAVANSFAVITTVTIADIPAGSVVAAGTDDPFELTIQPDGSMSLSLLPDQLSGLNITPPQDFNGVFNLNISATSSEGVTSNPVAYTVDVEAANDAPELTGDTQLDVTGGAATISNQDMQITDVDNSADELFYEVTDGPDHGDLLLDGNLLGEGDLFTQDDIDQGLLQYVIDEPEAEEFSHNWAEGTPAWAGTGKDAEINSVDPSNLTMPDGSESVTINYESESFGKNDTDVFGWYKIDENGNPGEASIIWGNTENEGLDSSFTIEGLQPGESFGLFTVKDGADKASWLNNVPDNHTLSFNGDGNLAQFNLAGNEVHETDRAQDVFSNSTSGLNDEGTLMLGFETGDADGSKADFNDLVVSVQYNGQGRAKDAATADSFSFVAKDEDGQKVEDRDGSLNKPL
jgi:Ca2+-binding RTX toxin-like protein